MIRFFSEGLRNGIYETEICRRCAFCLMKLKKTELINSKFSILMKSAFCSICSPSNHVVGLFQRD